MMAPSGTASYPSLRRARFAQAVLACIGLFTAMDNGVVSLLLEPMRHEFRMTDVQLGLANTTTFYIAYALLCTPMGMLADRLNRVRLLIVAMLLWSSGLVLAGLSQTLWLLVAGKLLMGAANAITYPVAMSLFSDYFEPERRAFAIASYGVGQNLGGAGAILLGGLGYSALVTLATRDASLLFDLTPWRIIFLIFGTLGLGLIPFLLVLREPARMEVARKGGGTFEELWHFRGFLAPLFGGAMFLACVASGVNSWLTPALIRLYRQQPGDFASWFSTISLCASIIGMLAGGKLVGIARQRGGPNAAMIPAALAAALCAPAAFVAVMPSIFWFATLKFALSLLGSIATMIPVVVINYRMPNELRGLTMGLYVVLIALANAFAAPLVASVSTALGGEAMLGWAMAAVGAPSALLAALCFTIASRTRTADAGTERAIESTTP